MYLVEGIDYCRPKNDSIARMCYQLAQGQAKHAKPVQYFFCSCTPENHMSLQGRNRQALPVHAIKAKGSQEKHHTPANPSGERASSSASSSALRFSNQSVPSSSVTNLLLLLLPATMSYCAWNVKKNLCRSSAHNAAISEACAVISFIR